MNKAIAACMGVCLVLALPATAVSAQESELDSFYAQSAVWQPCPERKGTECATVQVPLDYANPTGRQITLALVRIPATGDARGSLVVNPGGPGAGALDFAGYVASGMDSQVRNVFHVVAFDPRGVGESAPMECVSGRDLARWHRTDITPDNAKEQQNLWKRASAFATGCDDFDAELARFVGTEQTVRDMDVVRAAVGDETLNWLGFSYGTQLGAAYAERFPDNVGRMVLDGPVDPSLDAMGLSRDQSAGFQNYLGRFAEYCAKAAGCVATTPKRVSRFINGLLWRLDKAPMATDSRRKLVQSEAITALFLAGYSRDLWPLLKDALKAAQKGDGSDLQWLANLANDQIEPNKYGSNLASAFYSIGCWDYPATPDVSGLASAAQDWSAGANVPELARAMAWGNAPCSQWVGHSDKKPSEVSSDTSAPILIVAATHDPATPYIWGQALERQLATSTMLTFDGDGHTSYGAGNSCIDARVDRFLLAGELPSDGTVCGP